MPAIDLKLNCELPADAPIWRYMKLSTLLYLLMEKRSFIPKLALLRQDDINEGRSSFQPPNIRAVLERQQALANSKEWLLRLGGKDPSWRRNSELAPDLVQCWHDELADRRCVWCWHGSTHECMAQWRIYAREGVAIRSDTQSVLRCLSGVGDVAYGRLKYKNRMHQSEASDSDEMIWFPYFVKQDSYSHENEVRFAFREDEPQRTGCAVETEVGDLIKEIRISPYCLDSEATSVMKVIRKLLPDDSIGVGISGERSSEPWPREDSTFHERFEHALGPRLIDETVPDPLRLFPTDWLARWPTPLEPPIGG